MKGETNAENEQETETRMVAVPEPPGAALLACAKGCRSIAFPLISSGIYGYPVKDAWRVAIKAIQESPYEMDVTIAVIDDRALQLGTSILSQEAKTASPAW